MNQVKDKLVSTLGIGLFLLVWLHYFTLSNEDHKGTFEIVQTEQVGR